MKRSAAFVYFDGTLLTTHTAHLVGRFCGTAGHGALPESRCR
ncbi:MAG TPA: hypothetical protein PKN50_02610 [Spirochaetota bacterium]|nr:hypothetical protein [Spirochaetota bacterium]HPV41970.1 hypothetical protein [Spirochaetota bacterium]